MTPSEPLSVAHLTALIRGAIAARPELEDVLVEGELSNLSTPSSGHLYFTLKDSHAALHCVCFRTHAMRVPFVPEAGMHVVLHGRVDIYEQSGRYQLYVDRIDPSGLGALALAVEQLKRRLSTEGLFDLQRKRPLPRLPRRVVVITSSSGAALHDVCTVIGRRAPSVDIVLIAATVQGEEAVRSIVSALAQVRQVRHADVVLLVRGGGSIEDLMAFNDEAVVRAIGECPLPVICGVGHETDTTIADLAADQRAATPSAAAELAVPDELRLRSEMASRGARLLAALERGLLLKRSGVEDSRGRLGRASPARRLAGHRQDIDQALSRLRAVVELRLVQKRRLVEQVAARIALQTPRHRLQDSRHGLAALRLRLAHQLPQVTAMSRRRLHDIAVRLELASPQARVTGGRHQLTALSVRLHARAEAGASQRRTQLRQRNLSLAALSPVAVLRRGYSMTLGPGGEALTDPSALVPGDRLHTVLAAGSVESEVRATDGAERMYDATGLGPEEVNHERR